MFGFNNRGMVPYEGNGSLFDSFFGEPFFSTVMSGSMKTDIQETEKGYKVAVDIPGAEKKDISINYADGGTLTVSVSRSEENKVEKDGYLRHERRAGQSSRAFYLPGVDRKEISAKYEDGVLSILLPKSGEENGNTTGIEIQ